MVSTSFMRPALGLGVLAIFTTGIWYLSYGLRPAPPPWAEVPSLTVQTTIAWGARDDVQIRGTQTLDAITALGYAHGWNHAWTIVLWRQAAQGRLAEWYGTKAVPADRLMRQLGTAKRARTLEASLSSEDRAFLQAYTDGINAAFSTGDIALRKDFVRMRLEPSPWEVWHTMALERLFAWLTVPKAYFDDDDPRFATLADANRTLHTVLRVHGFEHSIAWITQDANSKPSFHQRIVYGDIALPLFQELDISLGQGQFVRGISIPGTPFVPFGVTQNAAWSFLPQTHVSFHAIRDSGPFAFERIHDIDGLEHVARVSPERPHMWVTDIAPDSIWAIRWPGLGDATDIGSWRQLFHGRWKAFSLLGGGALWMHRDGSWEVHGSPPHVASLNRGILVGLAPTAMHVADALRTRPDASAGDVQHEAYSEWAADLAPRLVQTVAGTELTETVSGALDYVENWNYSFTRPSIAATIFDTWLEVLRGQLRPERDPLLVPESILQDTLRVVDALKQSTRMLSLRFGADKSGWRWEHTHADNRHFPYPASAGKRWLEPIEWSSSGHATAVSWNPAPIPSEPAANAALEIWHETASWGKLRTRSRSADPLKAFGVLIVPDSMAAVDLGSETDHITILAPRSLHRD